MQVKKIVLAVGPMVCSLILVVCFFSFNINIPLPKKEVVYQATAREYSMVKGEYVRNQILSDEKYIPFYSSSEMAIFDEFHPNMLAEKYNRNYTPFVAGRDAQGALTHFLEINSTAEKHRGKKVVYLLSPNSFQVPTGIPNEFYQSVHSRQEISHWLLDIDNPSKKDQYAAKRLLSYNVVKNDTLLAPKINKIKNAQELSAYDDFRLGLKYRRLRTEDAVFSMVKGNQFFANEVPESNQLNGMNNYQYAKKYKMSHLPEKYDIKELDKLAYNIGKESSKNNEFGFFDQKYEKDIGNNLSEFKGYRKNKVYTNSVEYSDFQLVLQEFSELDMDPLFIFMPINQKWQNYTNTSPKEMEGLINKIKYQLSSQGFNNFLEVDGSKEYTHVDAAHAGRRAWVEVDRTLNQFLSTPQSGKHSYKINDYFYSEEWSKNKLDR